MLKKIIETTKPYFPLKIMEVKWDNPLLELIGDNWNFKTISTWRISTKERMVFGCFDDNSTEKAQILKNLEIIEIRHQTRFSRIDPIFCLSNGFYLEIFSTNSKEPWVFNVSEKHLFTPKLGKLTILEQAMDDSWRYYQD